MSGGGQEGTTDGRGRRWDKGTEGDRWGDKWDGGGGMGDKGVQCMLEVIQCIL